MTNLQMMNAIKRLDPSVEFFGRIMTQGVPDHILSGFFIERTAHSNYFLEVQIPLCDKLDLIYLAFGRRIHGLEKTSNSKAERERLARTFLECVQARRSEATRLAKLDEFLNQYARLAISLPLVPRRAFGNCLILSGRLEEAKTFLQGVLSELETDSSAAATTDNVRKIFHEDTVALYQELMSNPDKATEMLMRWEAGTKEAIRNGKLHV